MNDYYDCLKTILMVHPTKQAIFLHKWDSIADFSLRSTILPDYRQLLVFEKFVFIFTNPNLNKMRD
jgi:hypothetical protein